MMVPLPKGTFVAFLRTGRLGFGILSTDYFPVGSAGSMNVEVVFPAPENGVEVIDVQDREMLAYAKPERQQPLARGLELALPAILLRVAERLLQAEDEIARLKKRA